MGMVKERLRVWVRGNVRVIDKGKVLHSSKGEGDW